MFGSAGAASSGLLAGVGAEALCAALSPLVGVMAPGVADPVPDTESGPCPPAAIEVSPAGLGVVAIVDVEAPVSETVTTGVDGVASVGACVTVVTLVVTEAVGAGEDCSETTVVVTVGAGDDATVCCSAAGALG
jgi:hypothetical protein